MERVAYSDLRFGDVGFYAGAGTLSGAIIKFTRRKDLGGLPSPSHAFIVCSRTQVIEALEKTKIRPLEVYRQSFLDGRAVAFRPPGSMNAKRIAMTRFVEKYEGAAYGWFQILGFLPVLWARNRLGIAVPNPSSLGEICSEGALLWLRDLRQELLTREEWQAVNALRWSIDLNRNTTDPALLMSCCLHDRIPGAQ